MIENQGTPLEVVKVPNKSSLTETMEKYQGATYRKITQIEANRIRRNIEGRLTSELMKL